MRTRLLRPRKLSIHCGVPLGLFQFYRLFLKCILTDEKTNQSAARDAWNRTSEDKHGWYSVKEKGKFHRDNSPAFCTVHHLSKPIYQKQCLSTYTCFYKKKKEINICSIANRSVCPRVHGPIVGSRHSCKWFDTNICKWIEWKWSKEYGKKKKKQRERGLYLWIRVKLSHNTKFFCMLLFGLYTGLWIKFISPWVMVKKRAQNNDS